MFLYKSSFIMLLFKCTLHDRTLFSELTANREEKWDSIRYIYILKNLFHLFCAINFFFFRSSKLNVLWVSRTTYDVPRSLAIQILQKRISRKSMSRFCHSYSEINSFYILLSCERAWAFFISLLTFLHILVKLKKYS